MNRNDTQKAIESGKTVLGIEFGSTRIKAVLIGEDHTSIASGSYEWENQYENGIWTYSLEEVWAGLQASYQSIENGDEWQALEARHKSVHRHLQCELQNRGLPHPNSRRSRQTCQFAVLLSWESNNSW